MEMNMSEIIIKNVSKRFNKQLVLDNINMELTSGHIYGIAGINGSGKTVLMKCICGLIMPTMGSVHVDGKQIGKDIDFPDSIGALIETPGFIEYYNALDNMLSLASIKKITTKDEIIALLEKVGLDPNEKKKVKKYSLGMRQKLGIAMALLDNPDILSATPVCFSFLPEQPLRTRAIVQIHNTHKPKCIEYKHTRFITSPPLIFYANFF
jgi:ABC-2 type transport system ATP-binding protein